MASNAYQLEAASRLRARDVTLVNLPQVIATRVQLTSRGVGAAGGSGAINPTPILDPVTGAPINPNWDFHGWSPDDDIVGEVNLSEAGE